MDDIHDLINNYEIIWNFTEILSYLDIISKKNNVDDFDNKLSYTLLNNYKHF